MREIGFDVSGHGGRDLVTTNTIEALHITRHAEMNLRPARASMLVCHLVPDPAHGLVSGLRLHKQALGLDRCQKLR